MAPSLACFACGSPAAESSGVVQPCACGCSKMIVAQDDLLAEIGRLERELREHERATLRRIVARIQAERDTERDMADSLGRELHWVTRALVASGTGGHAPGIMRDASAALDAWRSRRKPTEEAHDA